MFGLHFVSTTLSKSIINLWFIGAFFSCDSVYVSSKWNLKKLSFVLIMYALLISEYSISSKS